jgi:saccharopine dehydrogenase (NAD+, L-lysine-forming)
LIFVKLLIIGAGGVGSAAAKIAARRPFLTDVLIAEYDLDRAERAAEGTDDARFSAIRVDAADQLQIERMLTDHEIDAVLGATDPRFTMPIFRAALAARVHYLDMAMSLSRPHPTDPFQLPGVKLGDEQFALSAEWEASGKLALVGIGVEPGLADVFARCAADHLFSHIDELGVRDGANLTVDGHDFAPSFSIWTTIEECLTRR